MVDGDLFDKLAEIGTLLRKNPKPFGGIQVTRLWFLVASKTDALC